jgi:cell wall-associated NlpC family hydrolase
MSDHFTDPAAVAALRSACTGWIGTPFRIRSMVKGPMGGVDCAGFVAAVFREIGAITEEVAVPPYEINHAEHSEESVLRAWFEQPNVRAKVRHVDRTEPHLDGDLVFPVVGRTEHHLGIRIGQEIFHVVRPTGVCSQTIGQLKLSPYRYRLMAA